MTKKNWLLVVFLLVLVAVYAIWFTDWFKPKTVRVFHTVRELHRRRRPGTDEPTLMFGLARELRLTEVKVVPLDKYKTDPAITPLWHLVSDSNSIPLKVFTYGERIRGMKPVVPGERPVLLETNVPYRIFVVAGKVKGQHDFELGGSLNETNGSANP
jgi:hypothetical protein